MDSLKQLGHSVPVMTIILVLLASVGFNATVGSHPPLSGADALGFLLFLITATGVAGTVILLDASTPNTNLIPHLIVVLAIIVFTTVLGYLSVFNDTDIGGVYTALLGGGTLAFGISVVTPTTTTVDPVVVEAAVEERPALVEAVDALPVQPGP
jgi:hypothetical protein